jgi:ornithine carbamoyltransferase
MLGVNLHVASPDGYHLPDAVVQRSTHAARHGARLRLFSDPGDAVADVDAVYTDTWTSMGKEAEAEIRRQAFRGYQVTDDLMALAKPGAMFMHCLPAHRGEEVTVDVFESAASVVFDQAENRLHVQKALLLKLLAPHKQAT